ncbi:MAG: carotenoid 1,2-hydratase, partial [Pseudomonadota bacterium]
MSGVPGPDFGINVPTDGYAWWYLDALSDDGNEGLTLIAFVGSVFSPYYAAARRRGPADPEQHVSVNLALYRPGLKGRWAMTERNARSLERTAERYALGPSSLYWDGNALTVTIDERTAPWAQRLRGQLRVIPTALNPSALMLNPDGNHLWQALAPAARIELDFEHPKLRWQGTAYFDHNRGDAPLEQGFRYWTWSRTHLPTDRGLTTRVRYDYFPRAGGRACAGIRFDEAANLELMDPADLPPASRLPMALWRVHRCARELEPRVRQDFEDTPFYTRTLLDSADGPVVCEGLDMERFQSR